MKWIPEPSNKEKDSVLEAAGLWSAWWMDMCLNNLHKQGRPFPGASLITELCRLLVDPGQFQCGPCTKDFRQPWSVSPRIAIPGSVWHLSSPQLQGQVYEAELTHSRSIQALLLERLLLCCLPGNRLRDPVLFSISNFHHQWPMVIQMEFLKYILSVLRMK